MKYGQQCRSQIFDSQPKLCFDLPSHKMEERFEYFGENIAGQSLKFGLLHDDILQENVTRG